MEFAHLECIQRGDLDMDEKIRLFNIYKKESIEWEIPRD
jgi:hypothetical protein